MCLNRVGLVKLKWKTRSLKFSDIYYVTAGIIFLDQRPIKTPTLQGFLGQRSVGISHGKWFLRQKWFLIYMQWLFHNDPVKQVFTLSFGSMPVILYKKTVHFVSCFWYLDYFTANSFCIFAFKQNLNLF